MTSAVSRRGTSPSRHVYDAIVVGGQLTGALTTALLARHGLQVLHVPHDGLAAHYSHRDQRFSHAPFLLPPLKSVPAFEAVLAELGLGPTVHRALVNPDLQLLRPGNWFELKRDEKARATELKRALRTGAEGFELELQQAFAATSANDAFFQSKPDFPPEGFFGRWRFERHLARFSGLHVKSPLPAGSMLRALLPFVAPVEPVAALSDARVFSRLCGGVSLYPDGREGLQGVLMERARELGADVLSGEEAIESFVFEGSTVAGLRLRRHDTVYRAPFVVGATDLEVLVGLVPEGKQGAAKKALSQVTASKAVFTVHAVVPEQALPRGLGRLAIAQPEGAAAMLLEVRPATGDAALRVLSISTVAPRSLLGQEPAIREFISSLWRELEFLLPFTRPLVRFESTPWLDAEHALLHRAEPGPIFSVPSDSVLGVTGHTTASPWRHLLLANRQIYPGLGLEGEVLAASRAVERIAHALKKHDPLKARKTA